MIHKLEIKHEVLNRDDAAYAINEVRKARETLRELYKDKDKYRDKIRILSQHIHNVRLTSVIKEKFTGTLTRKKPKGYGRKFEIVSYHRLHENLVNIRATMLDDLKRQRKFNRTKSMKWNTFGIKKYLKFGSQEKGFVYPKAGTILELLKAKQIKTIKDPKKPKTKDNHIGVEIEFASYLSESQIGQLFLDANLLDYVELHHEYIEGRDKNGGEAEWELCVIAPEKEIFDIIKRVCVVLNEQADANITYGCGLHVHIDARNRDVKKMYNNLFNCQEVLYSMVNHTRRSNKHVQLMQKKQWLPPRPGFAHTTACKEEHCVCKFENKDDFKGKAMRFYGINSWSYISHKTMEVRIHSGSSNAAKINNWIKLLLNIVDGKAIKSYIKNIEDFKSTIQMDEKLMSYVESRVEYFKRDGSEESGSGIFR